MKINSIQTYNFHSINKPVNNKVQSSCKNSSMKELYPFGYNNYLSFGKIIINEKKLLEIGEENFPNEFVLSSAKQVIAEKQDKTIYDIHMEYFSDLKNCKTLEEAKEKYPEFKNVVDAKDLPRRKTGVIKCAQQGKLEGVDIQNLSLSLLKKHYCDLDVLSNAEAYWNKKFSAIREMFNLLNIPLMHKKYIFNVTRQNPNSYFQSSACSEHSSLTATSQWNNPEMKEKLCAKRRTEESRVAFSELMKNLWQDDEFRKKAKVVTENRELVHKALKMAWDAHPEITEKMSELAQGEVSHVFPKIRRGEELTGRDKRLLSEYNAKRNLLMPDAMKIIAETQKEILAELKKQAYQENE